MQSDLASYVEDPIILEFPYAKSEIITPEQIEQKRTLRKSQADRFKGIVAKKKADGIAKEKKSLQDLIDIHRIFVPEGEESIHDDRSKSQKIISKISATFPWKACSQIHVFRPPKRPSIALI